MKNISVVIIDDERSAREELKFSLSGFKDFVVLGEASNAKEAKVLIELHKPDVLFLDIQMPESSGFDLLEELTTIPIVVFTTAHHQFAIDAFEVNALDYLLKPIREERFVKTIEKIRSIFILHSSENEEQTKTIFIKDGEKRYLVSLNDIFKIESLENYTRLYFQDSKAMQRKSLRQWEEFLDPTIFFRINRTEIINLQFIKSIQKNEKGQLTLTLNSGEVLEFSSRQAIKFKLLKGI